MRGPSYSKRNSNGACKRRERDGDEHGRGVALRSEECHPRRATKDPHRPRHCGMCKQCHLSKPSPGVDRGNHKHPQECGRQELLWLLREAAPSHIGAHCGRQHRLWPFREVAPSHIRALFHASCRELQSEQIGSTAVSLGAVGSNARADSGVRRAAGGCDGPRLLPLRLRRSSKVKRPA